LVVNTPLAMTMDGTAVYWTETNASNTTVSVLMAPR
jgi:hypothetical protein